MDYSKYNYFSILSQIFTQDQLIRLVQKLDGKEYDQILEVARENKISPEDKEFNEFVAGLREWLLGLPKIDLALAFEPRRKDLQKSADWLEENLGKRVLLNISVDEKIVAGAIVSYQGRYGDYSYAKI